MSHSPGRLDCVFISLLVFISSVPAWRPVCFRRRRASAAVMPRVPVLVLVISSIISCGEVGHSYHPRVPFHLIGVSSLLIWGGYRAADGERCLSPDPSRSNVSWGKRRVMGFLVHRHLMPLGCSWRGSCLTVLLVLVSSHRGRSVLRLSCGMAACVSSSFAYRLVLLLVVSSRLAVSSLVSFSDALRAVGGACLLVSS